MTNRIIDSALIPGNLSPLKFNLPFATLDGTEKQIEWANRVRTNKVMAIVATLAANRGRLDRMTEEGTLGTIIKGLGALTSAPSTSLWIENRDKDADHWIRLALAEGGFEFPATADGEADPY